MAKPSQEALAYSAAELQSGDARAALAVRNREFGRQSGSFDDPIVKTMEFILSRTPTLLADCPPEVLEPLRVASAMMELWGTNNIRQFVTIEGELNYRFGFDAIAHMLHSHGRYLRSIENFRRIGISSVKLLSAQGSDECEVCRAADGKSFPITEVPEIPLISCICDGKYGCRIIVTAEDNNA